MIQFILNNKIVKTEAKSGMTLLDFIRENKKLKGTKIGCREGDCGACTVLIGTLINQQVSYKSITSCISPLGNANGKHIVTIEGINLPKKLNTVQQIMSNNYGTQCGFCTPGFIVSMTGFSLKLIDSDKNSNQNNCNDAVSGNICRCTGYKSIEKAGVEIEKKLQNKDTNHQLEWLIKNEFIPDYFTSIPKKLQDLKISNLDNPKGTIVASGTDIYVRYADSLSEENVQLINFNGALNGISFSKNSYTIGASVTVTEIIENKKLQANIPNLTTFLRLISSEQIRNMGTLGGNFANASPIGDVSIFFLALNSILNIAHKNGKIRQIPFNEFHKDYKKFDLQKDEILKNITFSMLNKNEFFNFEKVSKRTYLDIASVNSAARIKIENNIIINAYFSFGGVAAIPKYAEKTGNFLSGKVLNPTNILEAETILQSEISPISDVRGTDIYKRLLAKQLFFAHFITLFPKKIQLNKLMVS